MEGVWSASSPSGRCLEEVGVKKKRASSLLWLVPDQARQEWMSNPRVFMLSSFFPINKISEVISQMS